MYTAFYSHLKLLKHNRICPCNACATAPDLQLKIIVHCGELQFINIRNTTKPFGPSVIEVHRLLKNSVLSDNYSLLSQELVNEILMDNEKVSDSYDFKQGTDSYDGKEIAYQYAEIDPSKLKLNHIAPIKKIKFNREPDLIITKDFPISAEQLLEYLTNYKYRNLWTNGVDEIEYDEDEVTRLGTEHKCIIKGTELDFVTITKDGKPGQYVYGEYTESPAPLDELYQFYNITPVSEEESSLELELYWETHTFLKKMIMKLIGKRSFQKGITGSIEDLLQFSINNKIKEG